MSKYDIFQFRRSKKSEPEYMAIQIPDEKRNGYIFTDGCGKISLDLARKIAQNIGIHIKDIVSYS